MNITTFIKNNAMAIVAALVITGFSAFKVKEKFDTPQSGWYEVTVNPSNPSNESLQTIGSLISTPPTSSPTECAQTNDGNRCAIHLTFSEDAESIPANVSSARADSEVTVGTDANLPN